MATTLQKFYQGKVVLLTGASGFLGKMLLMKLLLSCPDIKRIIVLLRRKNEDSCSDRLSKILSNPIFSTVPKDNLLKVVPVEADLEQPGLGLSSENHELLFTSQVSVVFHVAAIVKFHEPLNTAMNTNTLPVLAILQLCEKMPQIKAVVFVSTAYSQCPHTEIKEKVYPMDVDNRQLVETTSDGESGMKFRGSEKWPNTYTYSKALAEDMIKQNNKRLPVAIFRPSMVINAWKEPNPGWIDNIQTITIILYNAYLGHTRVGLFDLQKVCDLVPVDMCVNAMIATAWETAESSHSGHTKVYNFVSGAQNPISWKQYWSICGQTIIQYPTSHAKWYYCFVTTSLWPVYLILWFCLELIPASLAHVLCYCSSGSNRDIKHALRSLRFTMAVKYFSGRDWLYHDTNLRSLLAKLTPEDRVIFNFDIKQVNWNEYLGSCVKGLRQYVLKDQINTLPIARKLSQLLYALHCALQSCFLYLCYRLVWYFAVE
ncbi:fatty acyl-CoA reductase 1-like isoform X2 [Zootermopsis nevadensis]|nr:fatty acyl-CoA reductase 1-like isoform X2 [Zootermopsis nevadensis]XP_021915758.1 fatty acyl-CoA reductase 1-like isoform X2 [Zootermopsis nevadensis]XP_021915759.1 fatty acyl-CoA reductase 1-like isoform X2 [Zootermopsis nevadensis]XP_021915760.1 fatty acyl-CoA reductase 1-like isoform X2 [Zootermopsis nevadensis]